MLTGHRGSRGGPCPGWFHVQLLIFYTVCLGHAPAGSSESLQPGSEATVRAEMISKTFASTRGWLGLWRALRLCAVALAENDIAKDLYASSR